MCAWQRIHIVELRLHLIFELPNLGDIRNTYIIVIRSTHREFITQYKQKKILNTVPEFIVTYYKFKTLKIGTVFRNFF